MYACEISKNTVHTKREKPIFSFFILSTETIGIIKMLWSKIILKYG